MTSIYLRSMDERDTMDIIRWRNSEQVRKYFIYQDDFTVEGHTYWLQEVVQKGKACQMMICKEDTNKAIGSVFIRDIDLHHKKGEFGIFIGEDAERGSGIGSAATRMILEHGFSQLGLNRIYLRVLADNARAIRSYEKAGFQKEGYLRDDVFLNGEFKDIVWMAALEKDVRK